MGKPKPDHGPFAKLFFLIGVIAGGAFGIQANDFLGMVIGAVVLGMIGLAIGKAVDNMVARLIFIFVSVIALLINTAIRRAVFEILFAAFEKS